MNVRVEPEVAGRFLSNLEPTRLRGFSEDGKSFGELTAYKVTIAGKLGYIIIPEKTFYKEDVFEIISEESLRETLKLQDGDAIKIEGEDEK